MRRRLELAVESLMGHYAKYFVEDFAYSVMNNLKASVPVDEQTKQNFVLSKISENLDAEGKLKVTEVNDATKFIHECAEYALEHNFDNPESRSVYDQIVQLPSLHHESIGRLAFSAASLYKQTIDDVLLSTVSSDVKTTSDLLKVGIQNRVTSTPSGGNLHIFDWGMLSNGLWLNNALAKAFELCYIFESGKAPQPHYATTAFQYSKVYTKTPDLSSDKAQGEFSVLVAHADDNVLANQTLPPEHTTVQDLLFRTGSLAIAISNWELALKDPKRLVNTIAELSSHANTIQHLIEVAKTLDADVLDQSVLPRLEEVNNAVTLCLVGFEALRETSYDDCLILNVEANSDDPIVDVFVNKDNLGPWCSTGATESDIAYLGQYLDPRKGMDTIYGGWKMSWATARKDDIVSEVMLSEMERTERMRANDAAAIEKLSNDKVKELAASYAQASGLESLPHGTVMNINRFSRNLTSNVALENFSMEAELFNIVTDLIDDKFTGQVADKLLAMTTANDETIRNDARTFTFLDTAVSDGIELVFNKAA